MELIFWVRAFFNAFWASDLGTIIFMLAPPTVAEGIVILFNSLSYVGYTDDSQTTQMRCVNVEAKQNSTVVHDWQKSKAASRVTQSCLHTSRVEEFTRHEGSAAYIHTLLSINESSAALTNFPTPAASCIGPACEAGLSIDA